MYNRLRGSLSFLGFEGVATFSSAKVTSSQLAHQQEDIPLAPATSDVDYSRYLQQGQHVMLWMQTMAPGTEQLSPMLKPLQKNWSNGGTTPFHHRTQHMKNRARLFLLKISILSVRLPS